MIKIVIGVIGFGVIVAVMILAFIFTNYMLGEDDGKKKRTGKRSKNKFCDPV
ncbi:MAG: hypothetical protein K6G09_06700 [Treponema sp.]|nr:hypothetical protein [Treponema sp.]